MQHDLFFLSRFVSFSVFCRSYLGSKSTIKISTLPRSFDFTCPSSLTNIPWKTESRDFTIFGICTSAIPVDYHSNYSFFSLFRDFNPKSHPIRRGIEGAGGGRGRTINKEYCPSLRFLRRDYHDIKHGVCFPASQILPSGFIEGGDFIR